VCLNITRVILWLLCNLYFVQRTQKTRLHTRRFVRGVKFAAVRNMDAPMMSRLWQVLECRIDLCRVTRGAQIEPL
jgi:hypothetical protein